MIWSFHPGSLVSTCFHTKIAVVRATARGSAAPWCSSFSTVHVWMCFGRDRQSRGFLRFSCGADFNRLQLFHTFPYFSTAKGCKEQIREELLEEHLSCAAGWLGSWLPTERDFSDVSFQMQPCLGTSGYISILSVCISFFLALQSFAIPLGFWIIIELRKHTLAMKIHEDPWRQGSSICGMVRYGPVFCCEANWWSLVDKCLGSISKAQEKHTAVPHGVPMFSLQPGRPVAETRRQEWVSCKML